MSDDNVIHLYEHMGDFRRLPDVAADKLRTIFAKFPGQVNMSDKYSRIRNYITEGKENFQSRTSNMQSYSMGMA